MSGREADANRREAAREDEAAYKKQLETASENYNMSVASGGKKKAPRKTCISDCDFKYAPKFMALIKRADAETFVYLHAWKEVKWDLLQPLFDELIVREKDRLIKRRGGHEKTNCSIRGRA